MKKVLNPNTGNRIREKSPVGRSVKQKYKEDIKTVIEWINDKIDEEDIDDDDPENCKNYIAERIVKDYYKISGAMHKLKKGGILIIGDKEHGQSLEDYILQSPITSLIESSTLHDILKKATVFTEKSTQFKKLEVKIPNCIALDEQPDISKIIKEVGIPDRNYKCHPLWAKTIYDKFDKQNLNIVCVGTSHIYNTKNIDNINTYISKSLQSYIRRYIHNQNVFTISQSIDRYSKYNDNEIKHIKNSRKKNIYLLTDESIGITCTE